MFIRETFRYPTTYNYTDLQETKSNKKKYNRRTYKCLKYQTWNKKSIRKYFQIK